MAMDATVVADMADQAKIADVHDKTDDGDGAVILASPGAARDLIGFLQRRTAPVALAGAAICRNVPLRTTSLAKDQTSMTATIRSEFGSTMMISSLTRKNL